MSPLLQTSHPQYHCCSTSTAIREPHRSARYRWRLLGASVLLLTLLIALIPARSQGVTAHATTVPPTANSTSQKSGPQYGEVGKIVRAGGLRFLYSQVGGYLGSAVGTHIGALTGEAMFGDRGRDAGDYVGDLFGEAAGAQAGKAIADEEIRALGWNVSKPRNHTDTHAPVDVGGVIGRWVGTVVGTDFGAVHGRRLAAGTGRRGAIRAAAGKVTGAVVGGQVGGAVGQWTGHTLQVGMAHAHDPPPQPPESKRNPKPTSKPKSDLPP